MLLSLPPLAAWLPRRIPVLLGEWSRSRAVAFVTFASDTDLTVQNSVSRGANESYNGRISYIFSLKRSEHYD